MGKAYPKMQGNGEANSELKQQKILWKVLQTLMIEEHQCDGMHMCGNGPISHYNWILLLIGLQYVLQRGHARYHGIIFIF